MTVYFTGHETDVFDEINSVDVINYVASPVRHDVDFSRCALYSAGGAIARGRGAKIVLPTALAEGWINYRVHLGSNVSAGVTLAAFTADDVSTLFDLNYTSAAFGLRGATSDTVRTAISPTGGQVSGTTYFWSIHWKAVSGGMLLELFRDGILISTATISNAYLNGKSVGIIRIGGAALGGSANANAGYGYSYSEIVVSDEDCRGWRVATLAPNAAGALSQWSGSYADIDEILPDDADFISSATADQVQLVGMSNLSIAAQNMDVKAVCLASRGRKGSTGPQNLQAALRSGGTNYFSANLPNLATSFGPIGRNIWQQNPNTSADFTVSEVQGIELGFKSIT